eukprot:TRINITY_DN690_c0_g1_i1.p1 TRINITY_DN690_c0_g1~~TRINITY_DN690_c0_g1_i1.p1  ORF type:complete len:105 (-),score=16.63 TRINITY_DN690_c0_g1_i1:63-377(-)
MFRLATRRSSTLFFVSRRYYKYESVSSVLGPRPHDVAAAEEDIRIPGAESSEGYVHRKVTNSPYEPSKVGLDPEQSDEVYNFKDRVPLDTDTLTFPEEESVNDR